MTFTDSIKSCIENYATFRGRASRSEYWWMVLFSNLFVLLMTIIFSVIGNAVGGLSGMVVATYIGFLISWLLIFLPMLAVMVRRLHDTNHSGWWYFIGLVPFIGGIWLLVLLLTGSDDENEYGLPSY